MAVLFHLGKFVNCVHEQECFRQLMETSTKERLLSIRSAAGTGKSQLLGKLRHQCASLELPEIQRIPTTIVNLEEVTTPFDLVNHIVADLSKQKIRFNRYQTVRDAIENNDLATITALENLSPPNQMHGFVNASTANFSSSQHVQLAGILMNIQLPQSSHITPEILRLIQEGAFKAQLSQEQRRRATDICLAKFYEELRSYCVERANNLKESRIVIMLDSYDQATNTLRRWIEGEFLLKTVYDTEKRPSNLFVVIAGQVVPDYSSYLSDAQIVDLIVRIDELTPWSEQDVAHYLRQSGLSDDIFTNMVAPIIAKNLSPLRVSQIVDAFL